MNRNFVTAFHTLACKICVNFSYFFILWAMLTNDLLIHFCWLVFCFFYLPKWPMNMN